MLPAEHKHAGESQSCGGPLRHALHHHPLSRVTPTSALQYAGREALLSPTLSGPHGCLFGLTLSVVLSYLSVQLTEGIWLLTPLRESQPSERLLKCCKVMCRSILRLTLLCRAADGLRLQVCWLSLETMNINDSFVRMLEIEC